GHQEAAYDVGAQYSLEQGGVDVEDVLARWYPGGVVDQRVDPSPGVVDLGGGLDHRWLVGDVGLDRERPGGARQFVDFGGDGVCLRVSAGQHGYPGALLGEPERPTEPARGAGHHDNLGREINVHLDPSLPVCVWIRIRPAASGCLPGRLVVACSVSDCSFGGAAGSEGEGGRRAGAGAWAL